MFRNLVANLSFNPGLIDRVSSYKRELEHEAGRRQKGFFLLVVALLINMAALTFQMPVHSSPNDLFSGLDSRDAVLAAWDGNGQGLREVYSALGLTRIDLERLGDSQKLTLNSNQWLVGRLPVTTYGQSADVWNELAIKAGKNTVYERPVEALSADGATYDGLPGPGFWIINGGRALVLDQRYVPPTDLLVDSGSVAGLQRYQLAQNLSRPGQTTAQAGDVWEYQLFSRNQTKQPITFSGRDRLDSLLQYAILWGLPSGLTYQNDQSLTFQATVAPGQTDQRSFKVKFKQPLPPSATPSLLSPDYSCVVYNSSGTLSEVKLSCPLMKRIEQTSRQLRPNSITLAVSLGVIVCLLSLVLYYRADLLSRQLGIIRRYHIRSSDDV